MVEQTAQQKADASAAWLQANRPDLVSTQAGSAEQAAATNAAYQANTLPVLPRMGAPATGYNQNDTIRIYDTTGLTDPRNQQGVARDVTPTEYYQIYGRTPEQSEAAKYQEFNASINFAAYANVPLSQMPANVASRVQDYYAAHPTEKAQVITAQYAGTRGGSSENPYDPDTALGIAWIVSRQQNPQMSESLKAKAIEQNEMGLSSFGGSYSSVDRLQGTKMLAGIATTSGQETVPIRDTSSNAPTYQDTLKYTAWELAALEGVSDRPGYTPITELGDAATQRAVSGLNVMRSLGFNVATPDTATARTLEYQRQMAWYTPGTKDEQYFGGEIQKWAENKVELASTYHHIGMDAGVPIPANVFEYQGDLAVEFLKGEPHKASERFSPVSGEMTRELPGGEGLQEYQWRQAIATDKQPGTKIDETWYSAGINKIISAEGQYGPYSVLAGARTPVISPSEGTIAPAYFASEKAITTAAVLPAVASTPSSRWNLGKIAADTIAVTLSGLSGFTQAPAEAKPVEGTEYSYRTDPLAVALEGSLYYGDVLLMGVATPGKDLLAAKGQSSNVKYEEFSKNLAGVEAQKGEYTQLGTTIETQRAGLNQMLVGKTNAQGEFTGTKEEYNKYQSSLSDMNANVAKYNAFGEKYKGVVEEGYTSGAIVKSGEGYIANPDYQHDYGAFSDWSASITKTLRGGVTESQVIAYEQTPEFKTAGPVTWFGEGAWKVATKPTELAGSALQGVEIYATMGLADVGLAAIGARGAAMGGAGGGALETLGFGGQRFLQSGAFQYGLGSVMVGASVYQATEGFTAPAERAWSNVGGLTTHLTAMGWGGLAPEGAAALSRFNIPNFGVVDTLAGRLGGVSVPTGGGPRGPPPSGGAPPAAPRGGPSLEGVDIYYGTELSDWARPTTGQPKPKSPTQPPSPESGSAAIALPEPTTPSYNIRRVFDETYMPSPEKLPSISEDMFTAGSAMDVKAQRLIATSETGRVVGATAFEVRGNEIFVKSMGSRQPGVGSAMTRELRDIADRYGATKITGESRPQAAGFWEKMGAEVTVPEGGKGAYPFEIRVSSEAPSLVKPIKSPVPSDAGPLERIQYALRYNPPEKTIAAMEYIRARYPGQESIWERYATDIQQLEPLRAPEEAPKKTIGLRYAELPSPLEIPTATELKLQLLARQPEAIPTIDLTTAPVPRASIVDRMESYATPTERSMIFQQYGFTPAEIEYAKVNKASLNDILALRAEYVQPQTAVVTEAKYGEMLAYWERPYTPASHFAVEETALGMSTKDYARTFGVTSPATKPTEAQDYARAFAVETIPDYARKFDLSTPQDYSRKVDLKQPQDYARTFAVTQPQDYARTADLYTPKDYARTYDEIVTKPPNEVPPWYPTDGGGGPGPEIPPPPFVIPGWAPSGGGGGGGSKSPWRKVQREMFYIGPKKVVMKKPKMPTMRRKK